MSGARLTLWPVCVPEDEPGAAGCCGDDPRGGDGERVGVVALGINRGHVMGLVIVVCLIKNARRPVHPSVPMAPFTLHGLNVVQPVERDAHDLAAPFPDFSAHLDLWTNLAFDSDEPLASSDQPKRRLTDDDDDDTPSPLGLPKNQDSHENAVLPPTALPNPPSFDINALLAGFGIDPLLIPTPPPAPVQRNAPSQAHPVSSLAQLLALHAAHAGSFPVPSPPSAATAASPPVASPSNPAPSKRARSQKSSSSSDNNTDPHPTTPTPQSPDEPTQSEPNATVLSAAEDKRRRNTAASARFRLKKKEREAALERRAKELEERVVELERECEGLRRENGWLKGLVVGVTGAGAAQHQQAPAK